LENFKFARSRQPVKLIGVNAPFEPKIQIGIEFSASDEPRESFNNQWSTTNIQGRMESGGAIKSPLPIRQQTIHLSQLPQQVQREIISGFSTSENLGRDRPFNHIAYHEVKVGKALAPANKRAVSARKMVSDERSALRANSANSHR